VYIYKITNKLDGKQYIGKTRRDPYIRWREHKAYSHKDNPYSYLWRAIKKYGIENFIFEVLESDVETNEILAKKEAGYILKYNSLAPNGYNLEITNWISRILSNDLLKKMSYSNQGYRNNPSKTTKYIGVSKIKRESGKIRIVCAINKDKKNYKRDCETEEIAAESYDKLALYLYGDSATINFSDKLDFYKKQNLGAFFKEFTTKTQNSSKYFGVYWNKRSKAWAYFVRDDCGKKTLWSRIVSSEVEAAELRDKACVFFGRSLDKLNFPNRLDDYKKEDLISFFYKKKRTSQYKGVHFRNKDKKWGGYTRFNKKTYFCGQWDTEIRAAEEYDKLTYFFTKDKELLNFPDKIQRYLVEKPYSPIRYKKKLNTK
jgi:group I intron endonuclease